MLGTATADGAASPASPPFSAATAQMSSNRSPFEVYGGGLAGRDWIWPAARWKSSRRCLPPLSLSGCGALRPAETFSTTTSTCACCGATMVPAIGGLADPLRRHVKPEWFTLTR